MALIELSVVQWLAIVFVADALCLAVVLALYLGVRRDHANDILSDGVTAHDGRASEAVSEPR